MATPSLRLMLSLLALCWARPPARLASAQEPQRRTAGNRYAVIVVGLAGDAEHRTHFLNIERAWTTWLREDLHVVAENITVLSGRENDGSSLDRREGSFQPRSGAATSESIRTHISAINDRLHEDDSLWVFFLGHANYDDEHAFFHLPGRDINEDDLAELFTKTKCHEQVFWLTHACSGWFLKSLSQKGRIVITATAADREYNETEFPAALATVFDMGMDKLDRNLDDQVSIAELFVMTTAAVEARFAADQRAPTEHAQLDDNGDGAGTESEKLVYPDDSPSGEPEMPVTGRVKAADGRLAASSLLPSRPPTERIEDSPALRD
jgi:hypothetical protein